MPLDCVTPGPCLGPSRREAERLPGESGRGEAQRQGLQPADEGRSAARRFACQFDRLDPVEQRLEQDAHLQPGEWVLVHGAAGGVGLAAVDLAKALGGRAIAASGSDEKLAAIERNYAPDACLNISEGFRERVKQITGGGADIIYDPVGGDIFDESTRCIAFDGRLLVVGFTSGRIATVPTNIPLIKGFSVVGVRAGEYGRRFPERGQENFAAIWALAEAGRLTPHVHASLSLDRWRDAFEEMRDRRVVGRVVIAPHG